MIPVGWVGVTAALQLGDLALRVREANAGLSDIILSPLSVGVHFSDTNNLSVGAMIFAPTGQFRQGNLSNPNGRVDHHA